MDISLLINSFSEITQNAGFSPRSRTGLVSNFFPTEFNLSAGHQYVIPALTAKHLVDSQDISIKELCFRRVDLTRVGYSLSHLLLFEMGVFGSFGGTGEDIDRQVKLLILMKKWLSSIGIPSDSLIFSISGGALIQGVEYLPDDISLRSLMSIGVVESNIFQTRGRRNFLFSQGQNRPAGYSIEVFVRNKNGIVEIASLNKYFLIFSNGKLHPSVNKAYGIGFGFERICYIMEGVGSIFEIPLFQSLISPLSNRINNNIEFSQAKPRIYLIVELVRSLFFTLADGQTIDNSPRGRIQKHMLRTLMAEINYMDLEPLTIINEISNLVIDNYAERYPHIANANINIERIISETMFSDHNKMNYET